MAILTDLGHLYERVAYSPYGRAEHRWAGDVDADGDVDNADAQAVAGAIGATIGGANYKPDYDLDRDGAIVPSYFDVDDITRVQAQNGKAKLTTGYISGPNDATGPDNQVGYCGYMFNSEDMLYCVRFRHYSPRLGRWLERDPAGYVDGPNDVAYSRGSPFAYADAFGLCCGQKKPLVATFSGINSTCDYLGRALESDYSWHSKLGTRGSYSAQQRVGLTGAWRSKARLDREAREESESLFSVGAACCKEKRPKFKIFMIQPKTNTKPPVDSSCCDISITVIWSPWDNVPNQGLGMPDGESFWQQWGDLYIVNTLAKQQGQEDPDLVHIGVYNERCPNHSFLPVLSGPIGLVERRRHAYVIETGDHTFRKVQEWTYDDTGRSVDVFGLIDQARSAGSGFDHVWICHSQGCNMAMHSLNRVCNRR